MYKDKTKQLEYQRVWRNNRRAKYIKIHGGECVDCGSKEKLEFDHTDRTQKVSHRIWTWSEQRIEEELAKCRLLCWPCHNKKSVEEMKYPTRVHGTNLMYVKDKCRCALCKKAHAEKNRAYRKGIVV